MTRPSLVVPRAAVRRTAIIALVAALVAGVGACTEDEEPAAPAPEAIEETTPPETAAPPRLDRPEARWDVSIEQVGAAVERDRRRAVLVGVERALARWVEGAFRGDYPRQNFSRGFSGWTSKAARLARDDLAITTNAALGPSLVQVVTDRLQARLFVFSAAGVTGGATAKVFLRFTGARRGGDLVRITVKGDVALTRDKTSWRIFGYDLDRIVEAR